MVITQYFLQEIISNFLNFAIPGIQLVQFFDIVDISISLDTS